MLYFGKLDFHETNSTCQWKIFLLANKKAITYKWLQPTSPTGDDWKAIVTEIYKMEILTFSLKVKTKNKRGFIFGEDGKNLWTPRISNYTTDVITNCCCKHCNCVNVLLHCTVPCVF